MFHSVESVCFLVEISERTETYLLTIQNALLDLFSRKSGTNFRFNIGCFNNGVNFWADQVKK